LGGGKMTQSLESMIIFPNWWLLILIVFVFSIIILIILYLIPKETLKKLEKEAEK
jgi:Kef-type K+ transport system membrane component KefB